MAVHRCRVRWGSAPDQAPPLQREGRERAEAACERTDMRFTARSVRLITNREGRATGQAFVEFPTQAEAEAGLAMDRQMMGSRYVEAPPRALPV